MTKSFVIDHVPSDSAWAKNVTDQLESQGHEVFMPLRDLSPGDIYDQLNRATARRDHVILLWSAKSAALSGHNPAYTKQAAVRLRNAGLNKICILSEPDVKLPLILSDLPQYQDLAQLLAGLTNTIDTTEHIPPQAKFDYFICHSSADLDCALQLYEISLKVGSAWIAPRNMEGNLPYGTQILRAIERTDTLAILLTPKSMQSSQCLREVYLAMEAQKRIVAFVCGADRIEEDWRYPLTSVHRVSVTCPLLPERSVLSALRR